MLITIITCVRNSEKWIDYIDEKFREVEEYYKYKIDFEYFIYENNSTDNTKESIKKFFTNREGKYLCEDIHNNNMHEGINVERGNHMTLLRNKTKKFHGVLDSDYVMIIDSDVVFKKTLIEEFISTITNDIAMITPYCMCYDNYSLGNGIHYYDSLAVISNDNISYKDTGNTCLFKSCKRCCNHRKLEEININNKYLFNDDEIISVKSAFGSCAFIKTDIYNKVWWGNSICEHHSFCKEVLKFGKVVINPMIKTVTTIPTKNNYLDITKHLLNNPD